jgi:pyridoxamine 5'-phosphate oxidase
METVVEAAASRFGAPSPLSIDATAPDPGALIPRPKFWGGYQLWIEAIELWVEGAGRLHDRARWQRRLKAAEGGFMGGPWSATRLQP